MGEESLQEVIGGAMAIYSAIGIHTKQIPRVGEDVYAPCGTFIT